MRPLAKIEKQPHGKADGYVDPLRSSEEQEQQIRDFAELVTELVPSDVHMILFMEQKEGQVSGILSLKRGAQSYDFRTTAPYIQNAVHALKMKFATKELFPSKRTSFPSKAPEKNTI